MANGIPLPPLFLGRWCRCRVIYNFRLRGYFTFSGTASCGRNRLTVWLWDPPTMTERLDGTILKQRARDAATPMITGETFRLHFFPIN